MSDILEARAEIVKLARLLGVEPGDLEYLAKLNAADLRLFRDELIDLFYGSEDGGLQRFARVGNLLPSSVIASLTREAVGPVLAARIAGFVDPKQAAAVVQKLPVDFVTDITVQLDPRRTEPLVRHMPPSVGGAIAKELIRRGELVTLGQFVGFADEDLLALVFNEASDEQLLRIGFVTEAKEKLTTAIGLLSDERLAGMMKVAGKKQLWPEALDMLPHLNDADYFRVINIASRQPASVLDELIRVTDEAGLWEVSIPAMSQADDPSGPVAALLRADAATTKHFVAAIVTDGAWLDMRELLEKVPDDQRAKLARRVARAGSAEQLKPVAELLAA